MTGDIIVVSVASPDGTENSVKCNYVSLPSVNGAVGVLANHAPMLCALTKGFVLCRKSSGEEIRIEVSGGVAQVFTNTVTVLLS